MLVERTAPALHEDVVEFISAGYVRKDGAWRQKGGRKVLSDKDIRDAVQARFDDVDEVPVYRSSVYGDYGLYLDSVNKEKQAASQAEADSYPITVYDWLTGYFETKRYCGQAHDYELDVLSGKIRNIATGSESSPADIAPLFATMLEHYNATIPRDEDGELVAPRLPSGNIVHALDRLVIDCRAMELSRVQESLKYDSGLVDVADELLADVHEEYGFEQPLPVFRAIMRHWMWQAKRKIYNLPVRDHIMLAVYGKQGMGKSTWIRNLAAPTGMRGYSTSNLTNMKSGFNLAAFVQSSYIVDIAEISDPETKASGKAVDQGTLGIIKNLITEPFITSRGFHRSQSQNTPNITTLAATTNYHIYHILVDTEYRRFFELSSRKERQGHEGEARRDKMAACYDILWKAIDETNDYGYIKQDLDVFAEITRIQATYVAKTPLESWMEEQHFSLHAVDMSSATEDDETQDIATLKELYGTFTRWWRRQGKDMKYITSFDKFYDALEDKIGPAICRDSAKRKVTPKIDRWYWRVNKEEVTQ